MDKDAGAALRDSVICVTGLAWEALSPAGPACDPSAFLKVKKSRKFMGIQDDLAVYCAGYALASAGLLGRAQGERTGLYLSVGYIPFQEADIGPVLDASVEDGRFSMRKFADGGYQRAHPLLTFKCLPNMPAYHVSVNFDLQGPYFVTYPGPGQLYTALEEAVNALVEGQIDIALVGGVAHQRNFLVEHHYLRIEPPIDAERLRDAGAFVVLETDSAARARGATIRGRLTELSVEYHPPQGAFNSDRGAMGASKEPDPPIEYGAGAPLGAVKQGWDRGLPIVSDITLARDGILGKSTWVKESPGGGP